MPMLSSKPSDVRDPRYMLPRSPDCPNDITDRPQDAPQESGTCASCAWGFYTTTSTEHELGEDASQLALTAVLDEAGTPLGYRSRCGKVQLYSDGEGRVGAVRTMNGERRFFPGIHGNWAYERYLHRNPVLQAAA